MSIYQHFRPEEKEWIDQILTWQKYVEDTYSYKRTDFLDPRQQSILQTIIGTKGTVQASLFGGKENTERKRAILYPDYFTPGPEDYEIVLWNIRYPKKFVTLEHREILGSLMGLGLKREKFGDILMDQTEGVVQFYACREISDYLKLNFDQIGRTKIEIEPIAMEQAIQKAEDGIEKQVTASSLRLDAILAQALPYSREKVQQWIQQGKVKVNFKVVEQTSFECQQGDICSIRGYGRIMIKSIEGQTKKMKWKCILFIQKS
ncbi:RNA-binding protein YlmH [Bacillus oleivorans]|uniref:RNA-binding protein YlmH n=1 Tax=Bacillus oleivorans TaxID=1448271 RepID=A0A285D1D5_9BACI|nr:RNA-binding protein [Bacillus oleivorans]SNX73485.1 RNA-binding protein YlmH [Bacillus oleivorans]